MTGTVIAVIVAAVLIIAIVAVALALRARQQANLRRTFGSEYDRTVDREGGKRGAVKELKGRQARHDELQIERLDPVVADRFRAEWRLTQEGFVDAPAESVGGAHRLLREALSTRGYPTSDDDERVAMLSVDHADVLDRYRRGMATERRWRDSGTTDTEDLRQAMQHYRCVFDRVVGETSDAAEGDTAYPNEATTRLRQRASNRPRD